MKDRPSSSKAVPSHLIAGAFKVAAPPPKRRSEPPAESSSELLDRVRAAREADRPSEPRSPEPSVDTAPEPIEPPERTSKELLIAWTLEEPEHRWRLLDRHLSGGDGFREASLQRIWKAIGDLGASASLVSLKGRIGGDAYDWVRLLPPMDMGGELLELWDEAKAERIARDIAHETSRAIQRNAAQELASTLAEPDSDLEEAHRRFEERTQRAKALVHRPELLVRCLAEELEAEIPKPRAILEYKGLPLWAEGTPLIIHGREGLGKSWLQAELAIAKASGRRWFGILTGDPARVLILTSEQGRWVYRERLRTILEDTGLVEEACREIASRISYVTSEDWVPSGDLADTELVLRACDHHRPDVLLVDPIYRIHSDGLDYGPLVAWMARIYRETGATTGLLGHDRKQSQGGDKGDSGSQSYGDGKLQFACKSSFALAEACANADEGQAEEDGAPKPPRQIVKLWCHKSNDSGKPPAEYLEHDPEQLGRLVPSSWRPKEKGSNEHAKQERKDRLLALAGSRPGSVITASEAMAELNLSSKSTATQHLRNADFEQIGHGRNAKWRPKSFDPRSGSFDSFDRESFDTE